MRERLEGLMLCIAIAAPVAVAQDIFLSVGTDGVQRYASQALDSTYRPLNPRSALPTSAPPPAHARQRSLRAASLVPLIDQAARRHAVPPTLAQAVAAVESNYNPAAVSPKGAQGVMQLMPATARRYDANAQHDVHANIDAGVRHLKDLLRQYDGNAALALAAYNAGPGAVARAGTRIPPYQETMLYVPAVLARSAGQPPHE